MKRMLLLAGTVVLAAASPAAADDVDRRVAASRAAVKEFATALQGQLKAALEAGGPSEAISVCNVAAPEIAASISERTGWTVGRTSHKLRNPGNAPDAWEAATLKEFRTAANTGAKLAKLERWEIVDADGGRQFRYMKAIPTGKPCLTCHGSEIDPAIVARLDALYPEDQARGFQLGELRGAFTITQPID
ncbi:MAG: DUF3365 domain-containing protein [Alphaproteobacteria bacterium]|nr:DUF3365 domain-containing protein [Alphaproteobacteria bacterium]